MFLDELFSIRKTPGSCGDSQSLTIPECLGRGQGARALWVKSIGWVSPFPSGSAWLPQDEAGRSGNANSECGFQNSELNFESLAFPFRIRHSAFRILVARPFHGIEGASWFLPTRPLRPGLALLRWPSSSGPPVESALNGSRFSRPPALREVMTEGGVFLERGNGRGDSAAGNDFDSDDCVLFQRCQGGVFFLDLSQESQLLDQFLHLLCFYFGGDDFVAFPGFPVDSQSAQLM